MEELHPKELDPEELHPEGLNPEELDPEQREMEEGHNYDRLMEMERNKCDRNEVVVHLDGQHEMLKLREDLLRMVPPSSFLPTNQTKWK